MGACTTGFTVLTRLGQICYIALAFFCLMHHNTMTKNKFEIEQVGDDTVLRVPLLYCEPDSFTVNGITYGGSGGGSGGGSSTSTQQTPAAGGGFNNNNNNVPAPAPTTGFTTPTTGVAPTTGVTSPTATAPTVPVGNATAPAAAPTIGATGGGGGGEMAPTTIGTGGGGGGGGGGRHSLLLRRDRLLQEVVDKQTSKFGECITKDVLIVSTTGTMAISVVALIFFIIIDLLARRNCGCFKPSLAAGMGLFIIFILMQSGLSLVALVQECMFWENVYQIIIDAVLPIDGTLTATVAKTHGNWRLSAATAAFAFILCFFVLIDGIIALCSAKTENAETSILTTDEDGDIALTSNRR